MSAPSESVQAFQADVERLLEILVHSLYREREVFLRELIANASDALSRVKLELLQSRTVHDPQVELAIYLEADEAALTLTVRDSGVGMTQDELLENLGTIARSSARALLELERAGEATGGELIGQFGVGFYAAFMVAETVTVTSRSARPEAEAAFWRSSGQGGFEVGPARQEARGTAVELKLKPEALEFLRPERLREVVRKHANFIAYPIYLKEGDDWVKLNAQSALWREPPGGVDEATYAAFYRQLTLDAEPPLRTIHVRADTPIQFYALLYLPSRRDPFFGLRDEHGLALYARKVLIEPHAKALLPPYLRFVAGVVDAEDLPLNVSRETVQDTPLVARIRKVLVARVLAELARLAEDDPEAYGRFFREFGGFLKEAVATDPSSSQGFVELLRFPSTKTDAKAEAGELVSLASYAARMKPEQKAIYYLLADDLAAAADAGSLDPFRQRDLEVLLLTDPMDTFLLMGLGEYRGTPLKSVSEAGLELPGAPQIEVPLADEFIALAAFAERRLGERVAQVRAGRLLSQSPARLLSPAGDTGFYRAQRLMGREVAVPKQVLELNPEHALIRTLARRLAAGDEALPGLVLEQLYDTELLAAGLHPNPAAMVPRLQRLLAFLGEVGGATLGA